jgi:hypothetical protein
MIIVNGRGLVYSVREVFVDAIADPEEIADVVCEVVLVV